MDSSRLRRNGSVRDSGVGDRIAGVGLWLLELALPDPFGLDKSAAFKSDCLWTWKVSICSRVYENLQFSSSVIFFLTEPVVKGSEEKLLLVWVTDYPVVNGSDPRHEACLP